MPSRPIEALPRKENRLKQARSTHNNTRQHGHPSLQHAASGAPPVLLGVPPESLTHITSFLDPPDLLALAQTCKQLHAHVADDNTWRRAYAYQYLGITPESDLRDDASDKILLLRREEVSWRKEFILRYNLRRRWEYSRNTSITHIPHHSAVTVMHLMPHTTLLAASLQYGVVARSYPLSGKILRGFLDASGTLNGLGIGNPNAEFSPHVSSIALASEGGTAKILWGFRSGEVAVTTALRAMDHNRTSAARMVRCRLGDSHEGTVECIAWSQSGDGSAVFVSGGADGRVKLWELKNSLVCLWTSTKGTSLVPDACVKVAMDVQQGVLVAGFRSGDVLVWTGLTGVPTGESDVSAPAFTVRETRFPAPAPPPVPLGSSPLEDFAQDVLDLRIAPRRDCLSILVVYHPNVHFHRFVWDAVTNEFQRTLYGLSAESPIRAILPVWATRQDECDFVITGDHLGNIAIYPWDAKPTSNLALSSAQPIDPPSVHPVRRFVAYEDGAITALAWNSAVLVSGSSRGGVKVWDALTFALLRTFPSPSAKPQSGGDWDAVGQILLERDALVVSVGSKVLAWKAGPVGKNAGYGKGKGSRTASGPKHGVAKWQQQLEMYRDIAESKRELAEEQSHVRRVVGREKEQLSTLAHLGLSEVEAVEYVLMLSRDEEEARRVSRTGRSHYDEEGVFLADFDDVPTPMATASNPWGSEPSSIAPSRTSSFSAHSSGSSGSVQGSQSMPRITPSSSNHKIQVSPRALPEPMQAGFSASPLARSASSNAVVPPSPSDPDHFPSVPVSRTPSSASGSSARESAPSSPRSVRGAWSTPLRSLHSTEAPSTSRVGAGGVASPSQSPARSLSGDMTSARRTMAAPTPYADEDDDLRFAIELSLAEARSRGEDV